VQKLIAEWNTELKLWGNLETDLLSERWVPFLETWPTSGTTQSGVAYELPMQVHPTSVSESLLLRTPVASEVEGGAVAPAVAKAKGQTLRLSGQMIDMVAPDQLPKLFPTLRASDSYERRNQKTMDRIARDGGDMTMTTLARTTTDWGKFEPAIRRWETILGRPAPEPTKPDGKEGNHRLSSKFTEWMMGLPEGWITDVGLKRNEELKLAGNGVVPQQAELALKILLENTPPPLGPNLTKLPTPTVSDTYTDNLKSTQQKEGSMHSVTLAQISQRI
jgi:hypothetical protein